MSVSPKKYRKKPVVIDAMLFNGNNGKEVIAWAASFGYIGIEEGVGSYDGRAANILRVPTLEGVMVAGDDNWIIRGVNGEFYPCRPDIFEKTYEEVRS